MLVSARQQLDQRRLRSASRAPRPAFANGIVSVRTSNPGIAIVTPAVYAVFAMVKNPNERTATSIHAVIGVWHRGARTFYVKRSEKMQNYPLVWSLLSIQFDPRVVRDHFDLTTIQPLMTKMADERLRGAPVRVTRYLSSANCADNPMSKRVFLHLYELEFETEPRLTPEFYVDAAWLDPDEYERRAAGTTCGLCLRMWSDHCVRHGMTQRLFAPSLAPERDEATA